MIVCISVPIFNMPISCYFMIVTKREPQNERVCGPLSLTECFVSFPPDGCSFRTDHQASAKWIHIVFQRMAQEAGNAVCQRKKQRN